MVSGLPVEAKRLELTMRGRDEGSPRGFINTARLHAHHSVFDHVRAADAVRARDFVQVFQKLDRRYGVSIQAHRNPAVKVNCDFAFALRAKSRVQRQHEKIFRRRLRRIFENAALVTHMPEIAVSAIYFFTCC